MIDVDCKRLNDNVDSITSLGFHPTATDIIFLRAAPGPNIDLSTAREIPPRLQKTPTFIVMRSACIEHGPLLAALSNVHE